MIALLIVGMLAALGGYWFGFRNGYQEGRIQFTSSRLLAVLFALALTPAAFSQPFT